MKTLTEIKAFWNNLSGAPDFDVTFARQLVASADPEARAAALEAKAKEIRKAGRHAFASLKRAVVTMAGGWTKEERAIALLQPSLPLEGAAAGQGAEALSPKHEGQQAAGVQDALVLSGAVSTESMIPKGHRARGEK